ncbi:CBS domain-containing protein [Candidatus Methanoplasma termitum]|nr:CBS domain-containing protein [Candidatus Methanoplasma termitum]MCL2334174.1 CBS domain-containing protein [Candidatus Methanoplasma sp.]
MKELRVRDLMTTQVLTVKPTDTVKRAIIKLAVDNVTGAAVVDNRNHVIGMITEFDVLSLIIRYQDKLDKDPSTTQSLLSVPMDGDVADPALVEANKEISEMKVEDIMIRTVLCTAPDEVISRALQKMMKLNVNRLPVLEQGILVGILSRSDIIFHIYKKKI